jgi:hypothetical protein
MLAVARALVAEPKVLMIDEFGLAPIIVERMRRSSARSPTRPAPVCSSSSSTSTWRLSVADQAYVMNHGEVVLEGEGKELARRRSPGGLLPRRQGALRPAGPRRGRRPEQRRRVAPTAFVSALATATCPIRGHERMVERVVGTWSAAAGPAGGSQAGLRRAAAGQKGAREVGVPL